MSIGIAAVIIFALYLIDKNGKWRETAKAGVALVILAVLGVIGMFGYDRYNHWKSEKEKRASAIQSCIERSGTDQTTRKACEVDPNVEVEKNYVTCGLDTKGHVIPASADVNSGCMPPPPTGFIPDSTSGDIFDRVGCEQKLMKQVPFKLPTGAVLVSATKACDINSNGVWSYNSKNDVWIDISPGLASKDSPTHH